MAGVVRSSVGEADPGDASEGEEVRLVRLGGGTDEAGYAGCDAPLVKGGRSHRAGRMGRRQRRVKD
jgi:hypothetical protein